MSKKNKALKYILWNPFEEEEKPDIIPLRKDVLPFPKKENKKVSTTAKSDKADSSPDKGSQSGKSVLNSRRAGPFQKKADNPSVSKADSSPYTGEPKKLSYKDKPGRTGASERRDISKLTKKEKKPESNTSRQNRRAVREMTRDNAYRSGRWAKSLTTSKSVNDIYEDVMKKDAYEYYSQFSDVDIKNAISFIKRDNAHQGNSYIKDEISAAEQVLYDRNAVRKQLENEKTAKSYEDKAKADPKRLNKIYSAKGKESNGLDLLYYLKKAESTLKPGDADFDEKYKTISGWETDSMNLLHLTDDERDTVYYLLGDGNEEAANSYIDSLNLNARRQEYESGVNKQYGKDNPVRGTLKSSAHQYTAPGAFLATLGQDIKNKFTGEYEPVDTNSRLFRGARARGDLQSGVMERAEEAGGAWSTVASVGQGVSDFAFTLPLPKGVRTAMYALSPAGSNTLDALERGANPHQATMYGAATGIANAATNYLPTEHALKILKDGGKFLPSMLKQGLGEGLEGASQNLIETYLDDKIMGDKSRVSLLAKEYEKTELSPEEALQKARNELYVKGTLQAGAMEALGGVVIGSAMSGLGRVGARLRGDLPLPMPQFDEKIDFNDPNVGLVFDDYVTNNLSKKVAESLDIVARALGIRVRFADVVDGGDANAEQKGNLITIEKFNANPLEFLLGHEVTHYMQEVSPAEYDAFKSAVLGEADVQAEAERLLSLYKEKGKNISADGALDEAVANYAGKLIRDTKVLDNFINKHRTDRNMLQRVFDGIKRVAAKLTGVEKRRAETAQGKLLAALEATVQNKNTAELSGDSKDSLKIDDRNNLYVEIESDILKNVPPEKWATTVRKNLRLKFPEGINIGQNTITITSDDISEITNSDYAQMLKKKDEGIYADKLRVTNNADEIVLGAENWGNESPNHTRNDNITDFERGYILMRIGNKDYEAEVLLAHRKSGNTSLRDIYKLVPTKKIGAEQAAVTQSELRDRHSTPIDDIISHRWGKSNYKFSSESSQTKTDMELALERALKKKEVSRQSLKGSEALSDAEVSEALADIDNEQNVPTNQQNDAPKTAAQSVTAFAEKYIQNPLRWAYQRTVSGQAPLERLSKGQRALNGDQSITAEDLVQQVRGAGGIVDAVLEDGLFNIDGTRMEMGGERAPSWREMTARIPRGKEADFNTYLQHRHNVDRVAQGTPLLAVSAEERQRTVNTLEAQNPEFKALAEEFYSYWDLFMREWAVKGGLLSEEAYTRFREMYPSYIPGFRVDTMSAAAKAAGRGMPVGTRRAIRNAEGGSSEIMDIRDSFPIYINRFIKYQRQNDLYLNLAEWARENPVDAAEMGIVLPGNARQGESRETSLDIYEALSELENNGLTPGMFNMHTVTAFEDGKRVSVNVNQDIYEALDFLVNPKMGDIQKIARTITGLSKNMITQYNPIFVATNMMKDFQTGYIHSMQHNPLKYTARVFEAGKEIAENSERFREYKALGGARSGFYSRNDGFVESHGKKYGESDNKFKDTVKKIARGAGRIADVSEQAVRFAEYLNYLEKHGDTPENRRKAVLAAADITTNFSRSGPATKAADSITMYLNAGVQGVDKMRRQMSDKKTAFPTLLKAGISNALMSGIIGSLIPAIFGGTPNEENPHYKELTEYVKDNNYILPNIWNKDENGYPKTFFKIPKSREYGAIFGGAYNRIAGALTGDKEAFDERSMREWGKNIANNVAPASPFTDSLPMAMRDIWANNKDWAGSSIVPQSMQELSPQNQYDAGTSEISKVISKVLPISPMKLDETIRAFGGSTYGEGLLKLGTKTNDGIAGKMADIFLEPVKSKFTADPLYSSKSVSKFFDDKERAITAAKDRNIEEGLPSEYRTPEEVRVTSYNKTADEMADLMNEERRLLNTMPNTPARKALIDAIRAKRIELARGAEGNAESAYSEYAKNYVPEISMLSPKAQATARTMNEKYGVSYDTFKTLTGETLADADSSEATQEKFTKALPLPVQEFVNSTKKEESNAELRRYLIFNTEGLSPEAKSELDKYLSGGELKNPVDYTDEESFYYSLLTEAKQKRYGEAHSRWGNLTKKKYYKIIDACRGLKKKADIIAELERQGFWGDAPYQFYSIVFK